MLLLMLIENGSHLDRVTPFEAQSQVKVKNNCKKDGTPYFNHILPH